MSYCPLCHRADIPRTDIRVYNNNEFTTFTCCNSPNQHRVIEFTYPLYNDLLTAVIDEMYEVWSNPIHWEFTDHSLTHSARVFKYGEKLMLPLKQSEYPLIAEEILIFILAAYLHDAGMQIISQEICKKLEKIQENEGSLLKDRYNLYASIRKQHAQRAPEVLVELLRKILTVRNPRLKDLGSSLIEPLEYICRLHSGKSEELNKLVIKDLMIPGREIQIKKERIKMLAGILRFADELDLSSERVFNRSNLNNLPLGVLSRLHWLKHVLVKGVYIDEHQKINLKLLHPPLSKNEMENEKFIYNRIVYWIKLKLDCEWNFITQEEDMISKGCRNLINPGLPKENIEEDRLSDPFNPFDGENIMEKIKGILDGEIKKLQAKKDLNLSFNLNTQQKVNSPEFMDISNIIEKSIEPEKQDTIKQDQEMDKQIEAEKKNNTLVEQKNEVKNNQKSDILKNFIRSEVKIEKPVHLKYNALDVIKHTGLNHYLLGDYSFAEKILLAVLEKRPDDIEILTILAELSYARKEYNLSIKFCKKINHLKPDVYQVLWNMMVIYKQLGRVNEAIECCEKMFTLKPDDYENLNDIGFTYKELRQFNKAIEYYEKALQINPIAYNILNDLGDTYVDIRDFVKAINCFKKALDIKPDFFIGYYNLGRTYVEAKEFEKAIECCEEILKVNPNLYNAYSIIGYAYAKWKKYEKAIECCEKAININPHSYDSYHIMGFVYRECKNFDKAIEYCKKALEIKPESEDTLHNLALALAELSRNDEARDYCERILKLNSKSSGAYNIIGCIYFKMEPLKKAKEYFEKAIEIKPDFFEAYNNLGNIYGNMKEFDKAIEAFGKALTIKPDSYETCYNIGLAYLEIKKYEKAIEFYKKAIKLNPDEYQPFADIGVACLISRQLEESIEFSKKALAINNNAHSALYNLACAYSLKRDSETALKFLQEAIEKKEAYKEEALVDNDFESIRNLPEFQQIIGKLLTKKS